VKSVKDEDVIELNIGGKIFITTKATLEKVKINTFKDTILNSKKDKNGRYFLDRPWREFECILNGLRNNEYPFKVDVVNEEDRNDLEYDLQEEFSWYLGLSK